MNDFFNYKNYFFDFDGTICHTSEGIISSLKKSIHDVSSLSFELNSEIIGPPLKEMLLSVLPNENPIKIENIISNFRKNYDNSGFKISEIFPSLTIVLQILKDKEKNIFIVTNKPLPVTKKILQLHKLKKFFKGCYSVDKTNELVSSKNKIINNIVDEYNLNRVKSLFIGDTNEDYISAKISGIDYLNFNGGYGKIIEEHLSIDCYSKLLNK